ncbi:lipopolysaccharide biosynthesis protein [Nitratireductor aquibiodomus RA22]|uniref:Lipopolysaccharide biosynthesis protein n=2 Tax=Nitratireductor aquibiodomus TaxID=204799 RepID=I5C836_9HYPH|nr:lipopolysaccharide biosynthesis protein [Nitratireductor aquibiodomus RA22]
MFDAENPSKRRPRSGGRARSLLSMQEPRPEAGQEQVQARKGRDGPALPERSRQSHDAKETRLERAASADAYLRRAETGRNVAKPSGQPREKPRSRTESAEKRQAETPSLRQRLLDRFFPLPEVESRPQREQPVRALREAERVAETREPRGRTVSEDESSGRAQQRRHVNQTQRHASDEQVWRPLIDPVQVIGGILRARWLIVLTTIIGAVIGVMIALSTPKMYYAATQLLFDPRDLQIVERDLTRGGLPSDATLALIENQVAVITSGNVLARVVDELDLAEDPEFNGTGGGSVLGLLLSPRALISALISSGDDDGGSARHTIAVENLAEALDVGRNAKTFIITIGATTKSADKSALIATTTRDVFLSTYGELQSATAGRANREITDQLQSLRDEVEQAERAVADFKAKNDIVDAQGRLITDEEILRLNDQLSAARARTSELNARAAAARSLDVETVLGGALPEQVASPVMTELLAQYASLKQQAGRLAVRFGPRHPDRQAVDAELVGARDEIARELRRVVASNQVELQRAVQLEQDLSGQLARLKVQKGNLESERVTLRELEREANAKRSVYEALLLRARETGQQERFNTANVSVISQAVPPLDPTGPSRSSIAMAGMILGFMAGVGLGAVGGAIRSLRENMAERQAAGYAGENEGGDGSRRADERDPDPEPDPTPPGGGSHWREDEGRDDRRAASRERPRDWSLRSGERHAMARAETGWEDREGDEAFPDDLDTDAGEDFVEYAEEHREKRYQPRPAPEQNAPAAAALAAQPAWPAAQMAMHPGMMVPGPMQMMAPMPQVVGMPMMQSYPMWQQAPMPFQPDFGVMAQQAPGTVEDEDEGSERFDEIHDRLKAVRREVDALTARRLNRHRY